MKINSASGTVKKDDKNVAPAKQAGGDAPLQAGATFREHERRKYRKQITVCEVDEQGALGQVAECDGLDISSNGIGFRSRKPMSVGCGLVIVATSTAGNAEAFFGMVRHCNYGEGARYHTGVEFREIPMSMSLRSWLKQHGVE
jgi:hypothetical protein